MSDLICRSDHRRAAIRAAHRNGVDEVEVSDDGLRLTVTFLGRAPDGLGPGNVRIDGGSRVDGIEAVEVSVEHADDPELDDRLHVTVDRAGDTSRYRLSIVEEDGFGRPGTAPYPGFDQRYYGTGFRFWPQCPSPFDCADPDCADAACVDPDRTGPDRTDLGCGDPACADSGHAGPGYGGPGYGDPGCADPACGDPGGAGAGRGGRPAAPAPVIDYTARDYDTVRRALLERLALTMPDWVERNPADLGVTLVELLAYTGDLISYQQDAVATEAYLDTARRRVSVRRHTRLIDYPMHDGCNARAVVVLDVAEPVTLPPGGYRFAAVELRPRHRYDPTTVDTVLADRDLAELDEFGSVEVFEPMDRRPARLRPEHHAIRFWTWGEDRCVLRAGATAATLRDEWAGPDGHRRVLALRPGDVLVFEEVRGPRSGEAGDADPTHRQAVRLTAVTPAVDRLTDQPVLEVTWSDADALTVALVLAAHDRHGRPIQDVSVARGNALLVDHGRSLAWCGGAPEAVTARPGARPVLARCPVTQAEPYPRPDQVCDGQAARLAGIPGLVEARLTELWRSAGDRNGLSEAEVDELAVLFGLARLERVELREHPVRALRELLHRADRLLAGKVRRLDVLAARARAGTVLAAHVAEEIAQSWGRRYAAGLHPDDPVLAGPLAALAGDPARALPAVEVHHRGRTWVPRRDLLGSGPRDRHVVGELTDDGRLALRFGAGRYGAAPPPGAELAAGYRVGGGAAGNVGAEAIGHLVLCGDPERPDRERPPVVGVRNPLPALGGTEPESVARVRRLAPLDLRRRRLRAITAGDYAELASALPGVQRAAAEIRWTGSVAEAHVAVDALGTGTPSRRLLDEVAHRLEAYRRIGHDLVVEPARPVPVEIVIEVCAVPGHQQGQIVAELYRTLLATFRPDAVSFGDPVRVSRLTALAASVPGVRSARVTRLRRLFGASPGARPEPGLGGGGEQRPGVATGEPVAGLLRLGPLEVARCDNDPARPENGRLLVELIDGGE